MSTTTGLRHRFGFDSACEGCRRLEDGGTDDSNFMPAAPVTLTSKIRRSQCDRHCPVNQSITCRVSEADLTWDDLVSPILSSLDLPVMAAQRDLDTYRRRSAMAGSNLGLQSVPSGASIRA